MSVLLFSTIRQLIWLLESFPPRAAGLSRGGDTWSKQGQPEADPGHLWLLCDLQRRLERSHVAHTIRRNVFDGESGRKAREVSANVGIHSFYEFERRLSSSFRLPVQARSGEQQ